MLERVGARSVGIAVPLAVPPSVQMPPSSGERHKIVVTLLNEMEGRRSWSSATGFRHTRYSRPLAVMTLRRSLKSLLHRDMR